MSQFQFFTRKLKFWLLLSFGFQFQTAAANQEIVFNRFREIIQEKRNTPEDPPTDFLRIYLSNYEKEGLKNGTCGKFAHQGTDMIENK